MFLCWIVKSYIKFESAQASLNSRKPAAIQILQLLITSKLWVVFLVSTFYFDFIVFQTCVTTLSILPKVNDARCVFIINILEFTWIKLNHLVSQLTISLFDQIYKLQEWSNIVQFDSFPALNPHSTWPVLVDIGTFRKQR